jgi:hypothetical protein
MDTGSRVRVGPTDTLNTASAPTDVFGFHPTSPFHATSVLTTFSKITGSDGCEPTVVYDDRVPPHGDFHVGVATVTPGAGCVAGSCLHLEFEHQLLDLAGQCRFRFNENCAA